MGPRFGISAGVTTLRRRRLGIVRKRLPHSFQVLVLRFIRICFGFRISDFGLRISLCGLAVLLLLGCPPTLFATNSTHWSFQPLVRASVPAGKQSVAVDALVSSALARDGRVLAAEAGRRTLIRRLSFDLRGLPPSPEEVAAFLKDQRPGAYERLVESFLVSPQYGERWGRHWLDIVGYADSNGYFNADSDRPLAWKFRDYVVRSMNADKPLDQFIREQIAGDELAGYVAGGDVTPEMVDPLIATHFWRNAPDGTTESDGNPLEVKVDKYAVMEGSVQILGSAFLGLTLQCARCHDHKFEPVTQEEYYGLQAILRPAFDFDHWRKPNEREIEVGTRAERETHQHRTAEVERDLKTLKESLEGLTAPFRRQVLEHNLAPLEKSLREAIQKALDTKEKERSEAMKSLLKTNAALVDVSAEALKAKFPVFASASETLREAIKTRESQKPAPLDRIAATFEPTNQPPLHHLLVRGNHANEGKEIGPGAPAVFQVSFQGTARQARHPGEGSDNVPEPAKKLEDGSMAHSSGRRLALAHWLTSPENPILARVLVNRVWHYHFGQGLVGTLENLGQSGKRPVHPELLDWLASEFIESGWSLKHLHRLILNSATWKQGANPLVSGDQRQDKGVGKGTERRPGGLRGARRPAGDDYWSLISEPRRLDAESLRDAMLAVSGELDLSIGGAYVPTTTDKQGQVIIDEKLAGARHRSIYLQQRRTFPVSFLSTFDGPAHNPVCVQRVTSTVALQSLSLLNSEFVRSRARAFSKRVLRSADFSPQEATDGDKQKAKVTATLRLAFDLAYCRPPTSEELSAAEAFLRAQGAIYAGQPDASERVWTDLCQMLLASNAFLYVD